MLLGFHKAAFQQIKSPSVQVDVLRLVANLLACPGAANSEEFRECLNHVSLDWICKELPALKVRMIGESSPAERQAILQVLVNVAVFGEFFGWFASIWVKERSFVGCNSLSVSLEWSKARSS